LARKKAFGGRSFSSDINGPREAAPSAPLWHKIVVPHPPTHEPNNNHRRI
jgi:hypothetical protein